MSLQIHPRIGSGAELTVELQGDVDLDSEPQLRTCLEEFSSDHRYRQIHLDLSAVHFIGSRGIGILLRSRHELQARNCRLTISSASVTVRRVLRYARMEHLLDETVRQAE